MNRLFQIVFFAALFYTTTPAYAQPDPGGVGTGLELWLKADAGITEASDRVTNWADQSGNANDAAQASAGFQPRHTNFTGTYLNFNPVVTFDGSNDNLITPLSINAGTYAQLTVVSVYLPISDNAAGPWGEDNTNWDRYITDRPTHNNMVANGSTGLTDVTNLFVANMASLTTVRYDEDAVSGSDVHVNGVQQLQFTADHDPNTSSAFGVGWDGNDGTFNGYVPEIAVYSGYLSETDRKKVESYFALKYGVSRTGDYLASDGTTIWNATTNSSYLTDIAGIGRDDNGGLNQKQALSSEGEGVLTIALGGLAVDNASNANTFSTDLSFLVWGHDDGALTEADVTIDTHPTKMLQRKWIAAETDETGTLEVTVDFSNATITGTTATDFWLVLDTDADPTNGRRTMVQASSFAANVATFTGVDIEDGDIISFITENTDDITLPVELSAFDAQFDGEGVLLTWTTASETNNAGFEVQRSVDTGVWQAVTFVEGNGTTDAQNSYRYVDAAGAAAGSEVSYRLKQIDFDGAFAYTESVEATIPTPEAFAVSSYPNPFNPVATIEYQVPVSGRIKLNVYNAQGQLIETLVNAHQEPGRYRVTFDASTLASGLYMYRMEAAGRTWAEPMLLVK